MKLLISFSIILLAGLAAAAPAKSEEDDKVIVTKDFFPDAYVKYTSEHDIVKILVPLNSLNFNENDSSSSEEDNDITFFFVEADKDATDKLTYKGLYVYKDNKAKKLLDNGRDAAASSDDTRQVFFAAQDGLYEYKLDTNEAVKYGTVTDSIIGIAKTNATDEIYILTEDHEVYKVTDKGNIKTKVDAIKNAQEIVLDYTNNLYFYAQDKKPYVLTPHGLKSIEGLPTNPAKVNLIKPPFLLEDAVPFIVDNVAYIIYANGTSERSDFEFHDDAKPTAYGMEGTIIHYYAYNKKIYEYNFLVMILGEILEEFKTFLEDKTSTIQSLASQKRRNKTKI